MITDLLTGIRNLKASLVTGAMLAAILYLNLSQVVPPVVTPSPALTRLMDLTAPYGVWVLVILLSYFAGSTYLSALETVIDRIHNRNTTARLPTKYRWPRRRLRGLLAPYSEKALTRTQSYAEQYYRKIISQRETAADTSNLPSECEFVASVLRDILWIEGKLVGGNLEAPYSQMRSDGEFRVGTGVLLPFLTATLLRSLDLDGWYVPAVIVPSVAAAITLVVQGLYQYRKANSMLAHHVADGVLTTPSMETLKRLLESA